MAASHQRLAFTKLTCVHYARGDLIGKALAHASLLPVLLLCAQAAKVYSRREVHEAAVLAGLVATEAVARGLKHLVRSPRPAEGCALLGVCDAHGMPSSHTAMAFAYAALSAAAAAALAARRRPAARALAALEVFGCGAAAALVAASRVYLGYHSPAQVAAGAALGLALGLAWHAAMAAAGRAGLFAAAARGPLAELVGAKDTWGCAEPLRLERGLDYGSVGGGGGGGGGGAAGQGKKRS
ncbi:dolichyldiphosphatase-like [Raphidocelis subcapitata]|uniref:Dolichyldiphosphatase-like n=1 Tax=Raphidocelis subcapitata TaxID=307507 RepID=A0A2V0PHH1_9CHLO|nr:dolichyldiphosphatase-like [Raphidocelis subcapitata]|eukprot:GBF99271.1 dolichyldiphosphatase-like [Raphidocelis subcapitata]